MSGAVLARTVIGIIGNVTSFGLFASPMKTFYRILKHKSVEEFQYYPYIAGVMNCIFWVFYGIITPNSTLVITINSIGLALELIYLAIFFYFSKERRCRIAIVLWLLAEVVVTAAIACIALLAIHSQIKRSILVGVFSVVFGLVLYFSPLMNAYKVIKTKSVEFTTPYLSLAGFCNGVIWAVYALIRIPPTMRVDWYILVGNGIGAIFSFAQLALYAFYYKSTPQSKTSDDLKKPKPEVQLSQV